MIFLNITILMKIGDKFQNLLIKHNRQLRQESYLTNISVFHLWTTLLLKVFKIYEQDLIMYSGVAIVRFKQYGCFQRKK